MESKFLVPIKRSSVGPPVYFVPSAGTTVLSLVRLSRALKSPRPWHAFEMTEWPNGKKRPATVADIADVCADEIRQRHPDGPVAVGGHCWGGVIAFEIASRLEAIGARVTGLLLLEALPPETAGQSNEDSPAKQLAVDDLCEKVRENLSRLPAEQAERFGKLSWDLIDIGIRHRAESSISAPVLLIRTASHPWAAFAGWEHLTTGGLTEHVVAGDAFSMLAPPLVESVGARLDEALIAGSA